MSREVEGRIRMVVSDDGTRCAAECPFRDGRCGVCHAYQSVLRETGTVTSLRLQACIVAEVSTVEGES